MIIALICISLITTMLSIFLCAYWLSICLLWRNVCLGLMPIFWLGCLFFCYLVVWAVRIFWKLILCYCFIYYYFLLFWGLSLHFAYSFLCCAEAKFNKNFWVQLGPICLFLFFHFSKRWIEKDMAAAYVQKYSAYVFF